MTDSLLATKEAVISDAPPRDDQLVYVPFDILPKDLLSKLEDFKVIVKDDKAGDRILPKERLGEVLRSLKRGDPLLPSGGLDGVDEQVEAHWAQQPHPTSPSPDTTVLRTRSPPRTVESPSRLSQRQFHNSTISMERDNSTEISLSSNRNTDIVSGSLKTQHPESMDSYSPHKTLHFSKSHTQSIPYSKSNFPNLFEETLLTRQRLHESSQNGASQPDDIRESECIYRFGTNSRVSMDTAHEHQKFLETTPRKPTYPESALADISFRQSPRRYAEDSYMFGDDRRYLRNRPSHGEWARVAQHGEVGPVRKQLFVPSPRYDSFVDKHEYQKENYLRHSRPSQDFHHHDYTAIVDSPRPGSYRAGSPLIPERVLKRKYYAEDDEAYLHPGSFGNARMTSPGIAERLLEDLHPSKRPCYDIGPTDKVEQPVKCACSMMESHFLQMTEGAYKNIRRKDSTSASFEQFRKELIQTNSVLKESVNILRAIQQICSHKESRMR